MTESWPCPALREFELGPRTTLRVGGTVAWFLEPATPDAFVEAWHAALERGFTPRVLGGGANLLVPDGRLPGVVITTARMGRVFRPGRCEDADWNDPRQGDPSTGEGAEERAELVAWAGMPLPGLVRVARELGWSGLEGLVGVPGHLGGGVAMNAGGRWGEMWDVVETVRVLTTDGEVEECSRSACEPVYRDGNLGGAVVLGAHLVLARGDELEIKERMRQYLAEKSAAQPVTERSCGCIFKNPDPELSGGRSAGRLVDECGGKGRTHGDAIVSPKHGNFIVNRGRATAADVLYLIEDLRSLVRDRTGIELEDEVKRWNPVPDREAGGEVPA